MDYQAAINLLASRAKATYLPVLAQWSFPDPSDDALLLGAKIFNKTTAQIRTDYRVAVEMKLEAI
mgnify:FL=1